MSGFFEKVKNRLKKEDERETIASLSDLTSVEDRHHFFNFACSNFEPSNYACWGCISQYKAAPNKRKMIFIDQYFTTYTNTSGKATGINDDMTEAYQILKFVNIGSEQIADYNRNIGNQVGAAKALKTFAQKQAFMGGGALGAVKAIGVKGVGERPDAFKALDDALTSALADLRARFRFRSIYQMPAGTRALIPETVRLLTEATFDARKMGIY
jgi:hypothetical protein